VNVKKPIAATAPQYVDYLMLWVDGIINDDNVFPTGRGEQFSNFSFFLNSRSDLPFPKDFLSIVKTIFKRMFRVYAHIYLSHFEQMKEIGADAHLNTCFKHFIFFIDEFRLVDEKDLEPLKDLIHIRLAEDPTLSPRNNAIENYASFAASAKSSMDTGVGSLESESGLMAVSKSKDEPAVSSLKN
jgi:MOB kinase activator 1